MVLGPLLAQVRQRVPQKGRLEPTRCFVEEVVVEQVVRAEGVEQPVVAFAALGCVQLALLPLASPCVSGRTPTCCMRAASLAHRFGALRRAEA